MASRARVVPRRNGRIFVSIPSYRDPECQSTIQALFGQAERPDLVYVGVCWQLHPRSDAHCFSRAPRRPAQIRTATLDYRSARGPCFARAACQRLWRGEEFYLQIDSHMRFARGWDSKLKAMLAEAEHKSARPILTTYPSGYEPGRPLSTDPRPSVLCAKGFANDGMLRIAAKRLAKPPSAPVPSLFWAAGYAFSRAEVIREVPYDPGLENLFFGEEASMAARLWTHGWDFFCPSSNVVFHLWSRKGRPTFRELRADPAVEAHARAMVLRMLSSAGPAEGETNGKFTLGPARSLRQFLEHVGVDFENKTITKQAKTGGLDPGLLDEGKLSAILALASRSLGRKL